MVVDLGQMKLFINMLLLVSLSDVSHRSFKQGLGFKSPVNEKKNVVGRKNQLPN